MEAKWKMGVYIKILISLPSPSNLFFPLWERRALMDGANEILLWLFLTEWSSFKMGDESKASRVLSHM